MDKKAFIGAAVLVSLLLWPIACHMFWKRLRTSSNEGAPFNSQVVPGPVYIVRSCTMQDGFWFAVVSPEKGGDKSRPLRIVVPEELEHGTRVIITSVAYRSLDRGGVWEQKWFYFQSAIPLKE